MKKLFTLFSLLLISISGMLAANVSDGAKIYFDASEYPDVAKQKVVQLMIGHSGWSQGYKMDKVEGYDNIYLVTMPKWEGCTEFCFFGADALWGGESQKMSNRFQWMPAHTDVIAISSNVSGSVGFGGKPLARTDSYQLPVKAPVITIGAAPEFATTTIGANSTATVTYTVENSEEKPEISLDNDAFTAEDAGGTITITFAPTEAKEYTATLTLTIGEVTASVELSATAKAEDAPLVPEILNLAAGEIAEIFAGETTEFEVTYTLINAEEATVSIEGEGFTIKKQDKGTATIEFAPTEAKTYEAVVKVTSGETIKTLEISATAKKVPVIITISLVNSGWGAANIYAWGADGLPNDWPGAEMTKVGDNKYTYDLAIPEDGNYQFILNNGSGTQTVDIPGVAVSTCYILGDLDQGKYKLVVDEKCGEKDPDPELTVSTEEVVFDEVELGEEPVVVTETITYTVENSEETPVVALESEVFTAIADKGTITITFAPEEEGEYTANLTITLGKIVKTVAISGSAKAAEIVEPEKPKIIITSELPEFPVTVIGETSEATITYEVENTDAEVSVLIQGEGFSGEDVDGTITIIFTPTEEKVYTGAVTITAGEISQDVVLFAQAVAEEEPDNTITFTVKVPEGTKECYIAGTSDDEDFAWKFIQMEKVEDAAEENLYTLTTDKLNGKEWKYLSGADWAYVEFRDGDANRTEAEDPYDVVTSWKKLYDPDFEPIDPYYAIRGLNGDASWTGSGDIKLEESEDESEWSALGFTVAEGESFKVIYIDENADASGWYAGIEENCNVGQTFDKDGNVVLPAGTYDLYFKVQTKLMWISKVDTPTDVQETAAELIYAVDGTIIAPAPFAIIDLSGKDVTNANGSLQGTYIVKTQNSTAKISVK